MKAIIILAVFIFLTDFLTVAGAKFFLRKNIFERFRRIYWLLTAFFIIFSTLFILINGNPELDPVRFRNYFYLFGLFTLFYIPKLVFTLFFITDKIIKLPVYVFFFKSENETIRKIKDIKILIYTGLCSCFIVFFLLLYGILFWKTDFKVNETELAFSNLPEEFDGFKIVQFSDTHLGSFSDERAVEKGIDLIKKQNPDIVFFTGDMINIVAAETERYTALLRSITAPYGKYAVLGNHDINDYRKVDSIKADSENISLLIRNINDMGFKMLVDESVIVKKGVDSIAVVGVNNWGLPPFHKNGDINKAIEDVKNVAFKILLSHDPSQWDEQITEKTDIALTLSGHTHAMQFGINCCGIRWSPSGYYYKRYLGLYREKGQYLYVNAGFGFIGFPCRVGIRPEITVIILKKKR